MKRPVAILLGFAALATGAVAVAEAEDALLKRYPYDPACAWGRVGNGKGMVVRCISEEEAKSLRVPRLYLYTPSEERFYRGLGWRTLEQTSYAGKPATIMAYETIG